MTKLSKNKVIFTVITIIVFYFIFAIISDTNKIKEDYIKINLVYLIPIFTIFLFSMFLRSLLQRFLLSNITIKISRKDSFILFLSGLSMIATPGGSGLVIKSHFIEKKFGYPIAKSLPLVFIERFLDLFAYASVIFVSLFFVFSIEAVVVISISLVIFAVFAAILKNQNIFNTLKSFLNRIKFLKNLVPEYAEFNDSMVKILSRKIIVKAVPFAIMLILIEGAVVYFCFRALSVDLGFFKSIQVYYTSVLFGVFSFIPGGVGITEGSFAALLSKKLDLSTATSIIILIRLTTTWLYTGIGFIASYFISRNKNQSTKNNNN